MIKLGSVNINMDHEENTSLSGIDTVISASDYHVALGETSIHGLLSSHWPIQL